jgi:outer membrane protein
VSGESRKRRIGSKSLGGQLTGPKQLMTIMRALVSPCAAFAFSTNLAHAADLTSAPPAPPVPLSDFSPHWFVRLGALGAINQSSSRLYVQPNVGIFGVGPQLLIPGRGESFSNLFTLSVQAGYFVTPNWSVEVAGGFPVWQTAKITGFSATAPAAGTVLSKTLPASAPITAVYHLTQFGAFQPYVGAGLAPVFVLRTRDGFAVGTSTEASVALILQGGFEYMFDRNWGVFFDAKKYFDRSIGTATGLNVPPVVIQAAATSVSNSQPWVLATGLTYRF